MELIATHVCMTKDVGVHGNLFGGIMLSWIDEAAVAMANQVCLTPNMVTRKMTEILFERPVKVGNTIRIYGEVSTIGKTSISLNMVAKRINVYTGDEEVVTSTQVVFVRIDEYGQKIPIAEKVRNKYGQAES